jgi:fructosamine-3-kinase
MGLLLRAALLFQGRRARDLGLLSTPLTLPAESLCARLSASPDQPACLIHGDLWSGNVLRGPNGEPPGRSGMPLRLVRRRNSA